MKFIASTPIALSVVVGLVAPASAFDAKRFWEQYDFTHSNG